MEKILRGEKTCTALMSVCVIGAGCCLITIGSLLKIPFYPVPFTLQTLMVILLALTQSPKHAVGSVICYLLCGTIGLPVFGGKANPFWFIGKCGGYLVGFLAASYLVAKLAQKIPTILAVFLGQLVIYAFGFIWLTYYFGPSTAFFKGIVFFIPADLCKNLIAISIASYAERRNYERDIG